MVYCYRYRKDYSQGKNISDTYKEKSSSEIGMPLLQKYLKSTTISDFKF